MQDCEASEGVLAVPLSAGNMGTQGQDAYQLSCLI